jgi:hypothetical protein
MHDHNELCARDSEIMVRGVLHVTDSYGHAAAVGPCQYWALVVHHSTLLCLHCCNLCSGSHYASAQAVEGSPLCCMPSRAWRLAWSAGGRGLIMFVMLECAGRTAGGTQTGAQETAQEQHWHTCLRKSQQHPACCERRNQQTIHGYRDSS